jgi:hypothetical protein
MYGCISTCWFSIDFYSNVIGVSINCQIQVINSSIFSLCWFEFKLFVKKVQVCANLIFTSFFHYQILCHPHICYNIQFPLILSSVLLLCLQSNKGIFLLLCPKWKSYALIWFIILLVKLEVGLV